MHLEVANMESKAVHDPKGVLTALPVLLRSRATGPPIDPCVLNDGFYCYLLHGQRYKLLIHVGCRSRSLFRAERNHYRTQKNASNLFGLC